MSAYGSDSGGSGVALSDEGDLVVAVDTTGMIKRVVLPGGVPITKPQSFAEGYATEPLVLTALESVSLIFFTPAQSSGAKPRIGLFGGRLARELTEGPAIQDGETVALAFDKKGEIVSYTVSPEFDGLELEPKLRNVDIAQVASLAYYDSIYFKNGKVLRHPCSGGRHRVFW